MAPPPSTLVSPVVSLLVRLLTAVLLLISIILLVTNTATLTSRYDEYTVKFNNFYAFRYHLGAAVVGLAYSLMQAALNVLLVSTGNRIGGDSMLHFDFYADKVVSYLLATAAAASFGLLVDTKHSLNDSFLDKFVSMAEASASLCFLAFLLSAISSVFSSFSLPKRVN